MNNQKIIYNAEDTVNYQLVSSEKEDTAEASQVVSESICAVASETNKSDASKSQDAFCHQYVKEAKANIIAIADGAGGSFRSEIGSRFVVKKAVELISYTLQKGVTDIDFNNVFDVIQQEFDKEIEIQFEGHMEEIPDSTTNSNFGTTLIVGVDFPEKFVAAYIGNGSILHLNSRFVTFPNYVAFPWNAINILNPHTVDHEGKESLYKLFFYKGRKKTHTPSVISLQKDNAGDGELFVLTTDGIYSNDHENPAQDAEGNIWLPISSQLDSLYKSMKEYVLGDQIITNETLHKAITTYLLSLKDSHGLNDDTTLGVFISPIACKYFEKRKKSGNS